MLRYVFDSKVQKPFYRVRVAGQTSLVGLSFTPSLINSILMRVRHANRKLERLEFDLSYDAGFGQPILRAFRKLMRFIRDAIDDRDFYRMKSLHYEKLKGARSHQRSMRLNDQFRLIVELELDGEGKRIVIVGIEDYH